MNRTFSNFALTAVALTMSASVGLADPANVADGQPWTADNGEGMKISMTLAPDGTGRVKRGIISKKISWKNINGDLCLYGLPGQKERCLTIQKIDGGYKGKSADGTVLTLTR